MKGGLILLCALLLVSCNDTDRIAFNVNRLEEQLNAVESEQALYQSELDDIHENMMSYEQVIEEKNLFDQEYYQIIIDKKIQVYDLELWTDIQIMKSTIYNLPDHEYLIGKLDKDLNLNLYKIKDIDSEDGYPLTADDLVSTNTSIKIELNEQSSYSFHHGEDLTREEFFSLIEADDFIRYRGINNHVIYLINLGSLPSYE